MARRRHPLRNALITLVVVLGVLIGGDRIALLVAERVAAGKIQSSQQLATRPGVSVAGFPFLTQFATGRYDQINLTGTNVAISRTADILDVSRMRIALHGVVVSRNFSSGTIATADGTGTISYAQLGRALHVSLRYAGNGRVVASKTLSVLGNSVTLQVSAAPIFTSTALTFGKLAVNGLGKLGAEVAAELDKVFDLKIPTDGFPFGISVQRLDLDSGGLEIGLTGSKLRFQPR